MGVDDDKPKAPEDKKPAVKTIYSEPEDEPQDDAPAGEPASDAEPYRGAEDDALAEPSDDGESEQADEPKKSKAVLPFCQFRFGDVAFFISQVELDRLNAKYSEYIDSGDALKESFASYLLKGVETHD